MLSYVSRLGGGGEGEGGALCIVMNGSGWMWLPSTCHAMASTQDKITSDSYSPWSHAMALYSCSSYLRLCDDDDLHACQNQWSNVVKSSSNGQCIWLHRSIRKYWQELIQAKNCPLFSLDWAHFNVPTSWGMISLQLLSNAPAFAQPGGSGALFL